MQYMLELYLLSVIAQIEMQRMELVHVWLTIFWNKNKWNQLLAFLSSQYYLEICLKKITMYVYVEFQLKTFTQFLFWNTINETLP